MTDLPAFLLAMTEKPRTWTMQRWDDKFEEQADVKVIELEPVLDLLDACWEQMGPRSDIAFTVRDFLREHGRLP